MLLILVIFVLFDTTVGVDVDSDNTKENKLDKNVDLAQIGFHANLLHDLYSIKSTMKSMEDQISKLNDLYNTKLDQKLLTLAMNVINIDGNVRNIKDKAHAWDMFQHHITAWNEQIKSLDRKIDIVSSGQEKMLMLDGKLGFLLNLEYNSQRTVNKLTGIEDRLDVLEKTLKDNSLKMPTIYDEFATRGVLSTLKVLEQKVDRSNLFLHQVLSNKQSTENGHNNNNETKTRYIGKGKYLVSCSTPPIIEELVKDVSSKVDLIYDKIIVDNSNENTSDAEENNEDNEDTQELYQSDEGVTVRPKTSILLTKSDTKSIKKFIKHLVCPSNKRLDIILKNINSTDESLKIISESLFTDGNYQKIYLNVSNKINDTLESILQRFENSLATSKADMITNMRKIQENNIKTIVGLNKSFMEHIKSKIMICGNNKEENYDENTSSTMSFDYPTPDYKSTEQDGQYSDSSSTVLDDTTYAETTTTTSTYTNTENEGYSVFDVYHVNVIDLSSDIITRLSGSNYSDDFCGNPGSERYCDDEGFVTIQKRIDGSENFSRSWDDYKWGFGSLDDGNFWIGNEAIHQLTRKRNEFTNTILKVQLQDFDGNMVLAHYNIFKVGSEDFFYNLTVGDYNGNASDSLSYHSGAKFSTYDKTNDEAPPCCPCSVSYGGGWWFQSCFESNLNGLYFNTSTRDGYRGIIWEHWTGEDTLAKTKMSVKTTMNWDKRKPSHLDP